METLLASMPSILWKVSNVYTFFNDLECIMFDQAYVMLGHRPLLRVVYDSGIR